MQMRSSRTLCIVGLVGLAAPLVAQTPAGNGFTYQGRLLDGGVPANGSYDLGFKLYDAPTDGAVVGTQTILGVPVSLGLFTVTLDFGSGPFQGQARWLEIQISPPGGTTLSPRQALTPSPYALFSSRTDPATLTTLDANNLTSGTVPGSRLAGTYSQALDLSNAANALAGNGAALTALNADNLASGTVPDARLAGIYSSALALPNIGNFFTGDGSGLTNLNAQKKYVRTVVVSPTGVPTADGSALLAALAGITGTAAAPGLLKIEPGVYDLGTASLVMKPFVDVEGSGEATTRIRAAGHVDNNIGTIQAVSNSELRFLTVENTGGSTFAKALYVSGASPSITHVTVLSSGGTGETQGLYSDNGAIPIVSDVTVSVFNPAGGSSFGVLDVGSSSQLFHVRSNSSGGAFSRAFFVCCGGAPILRHSVGVASGATTENHGVAAYDSSPTLEYVTGIATGAATNNLGVLLVGGTSSPSLRQVACRAVNATGINWGCLSNFGASPSMAEITADALGGTTARGLELDSTGAGTSLSTIRATGSGASAESTALKLNNCSPRTVDVLAFASSNAGDVNGFWVAGGSPNVSHLTASAGGVGFVLVVRVDGLASPTFTHVSGTGSGAGAPFGFYTSADANVTVDDSTFTADSSYQAIGVYLSGPGRLTNVRGTATGAATNTGCTINGGTLTNVICAAPSGSYARGLVVGSGPVTFDRSTARGAAASIESFGASVNVGVSQLIGPASGPLSCFGSYNGSYAPLNASCQ